MSHLKQNFIILHFYESFETFSFTGYELYGNLDASAKSRLDRMRTSVTSYEFGSSLVIVAVKTGSTTWCTVATNYKDSDMDPA